jgi:hypothetical protein
MHDQKPKAKEKETLIKSVRPEPVEGEELISVSTEIARGFRVIARSFRVKR